MNKNILIIEDDPSILAVYNEKLKVEGFSVASAATGKEGFTLIKKVKPDLVLLDIMLPGDLNGFDVLESMKKDEELKSIPVIVLTNIGDEEKVAKDIGASDYLVKANTDLNQVVEKIIRLL